MWWLKWWSAKPPPAPSNEECSGAWPMWGSAPPQGPCWVAKSWSRRGAALTFLFLIFNVWEISFPLHRTVLLHVFGHNFRQLNNNHSPQWTKSWKYIEGASATYTVHLGKTKTDKNYFFPSTHPSLQLYLWSYCTDTNMVVIDMVIFLCPKWHASSLWPFYDEQWGKWEILLTRWFTKWNISVLWIKLVFIFCGAFRRMHGSGNEDRTKRLRVVLFLSKAKEKATSFPIQFQR